LSSASQRIYVEVGTIEFYILVIVADFARNTIIAIDLCGAAGELEIFAFAYTFDAKFRNVIGIIPSWNTWNIELTVGDR
jgi:hypothetical protein